MENAELLADTVDDLPLLRALREEPLDRDGVRAELGVSRATSYRVTGRLTDRELLAESNGRFSLTAVGERLLTAASTYVRTVRETVPGTGDTAELAARVDLGLALGEIGTDPIDRRELEGRLDVSDSTGYRLTRALSERGLVEKTGRGYRRTQPGDEFVDALRAYATTVSTVLTLAPLLEQDAEHVPPIPVDAFADATVTRLDAGDAYSQIDRFIALVEETDTLRGMDLNAIAPLYIDEITKLVLDGMALEMISTPEVVADTADKYPYACAKLCINGNVAPLVHEDLPFGLALFDDRVGIGVPHPAARRLRAFVDTDAPRATAWAEDVFDAYRAESTRLEQFSRQALDDVLADRETGITGDRP